MADLTSESVASQFFESDILYTVQGTVSKIIKLTDREMVETVNVKWDEMTQEG